MAETVERKHSYHAEAHALSGNIILPLEQNITPHALTSVPEDGGYRAQQAQQYRLETVISSASRALTLTGTGPLSLGCF